MPEAKIQKAPATSAFANLWQTLRPPGGALPPPGQRPGQTTPTEPGPGLSDLIGFGASILGGPVALPARLGMAATGLVGSKAGSAVGSAIAGDVGETVGSVIGGMGSVKGAAAPQARITQAGEDLLTKKRVFGQAFKSMASTPVVFSIKGVKSEAAENLNKAVTMLEMRFPGASRLIKQIKVVDAEPAYAGGGVPRAWVDRISDPDTWGKKGKHPGVISITGDTIKEDLDTVYSVLTHELLHLAQNRLGVGKRLGSHMAKVRSEYKKVADEFNAEAEKINALLPQASTNLEVLHELDKKTKHMGQLKKMMRELQQQHMDYYEARSSKIIEPPAYKRQAQALEAVSKSR